MASATHPGEILKDELQARGMSAHRFALELGVPPTDAHPPASKHVRAVSQVHGRTVFRPKRAQHPDPSVLVQILFEGNAIEGLPPVHGHDVGAALLLLDLADPVLPQEDLTDLLPGGAASFQVVEEQDAVDGVPSGSRSGLCGRFLGSGLTGPKKPGGEAGQADEEGRISTFLHGSCCLRLKVALRLHPALFSCGTPGASRRALSALSAPMALALRIGGNP